MLHQLRRRSVLGGSVAGVLALALPRPAASTAAGLARADGTAQAYALAGWRELVGSELPTADGTVRLDRVHVRPAMGNGQAYELHFRVLRGAAPGDALVVTHPEHGKVPLMTTAHGLTCVAVVNRWRD